MSEEQARYEVKKETKDRQAMFEEELKKPVNLCECENALQRLVLNKHTLNIPARANDEDMMIARALRELGETRNQLQSAQQEIERLRTALHTHESYDKTVTEMHEREQKLIEGLQFYADEKTYDMRHLDLHGYLVIDQDGGNKAKAILKELGVTE